MKDATNSYMKNPLKTTPHLIGVWPWWYSHMGREYYQFLHSETFMRNIFDIMNSQGSVQCDLGSQFGP